ncbi:GNAT family N-acetyltransferase [Alishewanella sp. HL-SH05]|uniref:GNAT family N-acetyltransferase n=1 Tax=Alishewanella sp. HL-SH05 TaxID=3461145 RepID=UPI0040430DC6
MTEPLIKHLASEQRFTLTLADASAQLDYHVNGKVINFHHTFVPPAFRGKGLAEKLVRHALQWAQTEGYDIQASCSFVQRFL